MKWNDILFALFTQKKYEYSLEISLSKWFSSMVCAEAAGAGPGTWVGCISSQLQGQWPQVGNLTSALKGMFYNMNVEKAKNKGFIYLSSGPTVKHSPAYHWKQRLWPRRAARGSNGTWNVAQAEQPAPATAGPSGPTEGVWQGPGQRRGWRSIWRAQGLSKSREFREIER